MLHRIPQRSAKCRKSADLKVFIVLAEAREFWQLKA
jgi:hypothetical protein